MGQSGSGPDYRPEIDKALNQANQPKSDLSQAFSGLSQSSLPNLFSMLQNTQQLGNSFLSRSSNNSGGGFFPHTPQPTPIGNSPRLNFNPFTSMAGQDASASIGGSNPGRLTLNVGGVGGTGGTSTAQSTPASTNSGSNYSTAMSWPAPGTPGSADNPMSQAQDVGSRYGYGAGSIYDLGNGQIVTSNGAPVSVNARNEISWDNNNQVISPDALQSLIGRPIGNPRDPIDPTNPTNPINPTNPTNPTNPGTNTPTPRPIGGGTDSGNGTGGMNLDFTLPSGGLFGQYNPTGSNSDMFNPNYSNAVGVGNQIAGQARTGSDPGGALDIPALINAMNNMQGLNMSGMNQGAMNTLGNQVGTPDMNNYNPSQGMLSNLSGLTGIPGLSSAMQQSLTGGLNYQQNAGSGGTSGLNTNPLAGYDANSDPYYSAINQSLNNKFAKDQADTQESFIGGGAGNSTGASYAQAQLRGQEAPEMTAALGNYLQQIQANRINSAQQGNNALLSNQGQMNSFAQGNAGLNTNLLNSLFSTGLGQGGLGANLANQAGNIGLGQNQLNSQNFFSSAGLNSQNANNLLGQQNQFLGNQNQSIVGQNALNSSLNQFNANQANTQNMQLGMANQQAQQQSIAQQLQGLLSLFSAGGSIAGAGIPGGSANVNVSNQVQSGSGLGGLASGLGSLLSGLSGFRS